jgi:hypothetical protein
MNRIIFFILIAFCLASFGCNEKGSKNSNKTKAMVIDSTKQYGYNRDFLKKYISVIELKSKNSALILVPAWQGRVMTSTCDGDRGFSFGWINRDLIASGNLQPHINPFGGEERLWLGPEGGQFSIFFSKGKEFIYENWQTPDFIDTKPYDVIASSDTSVSLKTTVTLVNYSGTEFNLAIERKVTLFQENEISGQTGINTKGLKCIAYSSENRLTNTGKAGWKKESGLLSLWMLGMFNPSPDVVVVIPVNEGDESKLGLKVNDNYFGKITSDRLKIEGNHIFFKADGKKRGKIGIPPLRAAGVMGSFDFENNILTLLFCKLPAGVTDYVNSAWQIQDKPFSGDAFNSYNDGPLEDGSQMGPFYELETSSPAAILAPGEGLMHRQVTVHLTGKRNDLDRVAVKVLGVSLDLIEKAFK